MTRSRQLARLLVRLSASALLALVLGLTVLVALSAAVVSSAGRRTTAPGLSRPADARAHPWPAARGHRLADPDASRAWRGPRAATRRCRRTRELAAFATSLGVVPFTVVPLLSLVVGLILLVLTGALLTAIPRSYSAGVSTASSLRTE
jgi:hypothetical protein